MRIYGNGLRVYAHHIQRLTALDGFARMNDGKIISYQEFASKILSFAAQGLESRGLHEEQLLHCPNDILCFTGVAGNATIDKVARNITAVQHMARYTD